MSHSLRLGPQRPRPQPRDHSYVAGRSLRVPGPEDGPQTPKLQENASSGSVRSAWKSGLARPLSLNISPRTPPGRRPGRFVELRPAVAARARQEDQEKSETSHPALSSFPLLPSSGGSGRGRNPRIRRQVFFLYGVQKPDTSFIPGSLMVPGPGNGRGPKMAKNIRRGFSSRWSSGNAQRTKLAG